MYAKLDLSSVDSSSALPQHNGVRQKKALDIKERFGLAIRRRRRELDLSQEALAELAELHRTYVSSIERGVRNPSLENIEKLSAALKISMSALFAQYGVDVELKPENNS